MKRSTAVFPNKELVLVLARLAETRQPDATFSTAAPDARGPFCRRIGTTGAEGRSETHPVERTAAGIEISDCGQEMPNPRREYVAITNDAGAAVCYTNDNQDVGVLDGL